MVVYECSCGNNETNLAEMKAHLKNCKAAHETSYGPDWVCIKVHILMKQKGGQ